MQKKEITKVLFCWSGGKDSAYALHKIMSSGKYEVVSLLTTITLPQKRITMHGVREELLDKQAESIGLPLYKVYISEATNTEYEKNMEKALLHFKELGVTQVVFGDIFLEDLRAYREQNLIKVGLSALFPLWKIDTKQLINEFIDLGFKTCICTINTSIISKDVLGKNIDKQLIMNLNSSVDPCGENGEYHTFCFDGPIFKIAILFKIGSQEIKKYTYTNDEGITLESSFGFIDLIPQ